MNDSPSNTKKNPRQKNPSTNAGHGHAGLLRQKAVASVAMVVPEVEIDWERLHYRVAVVLEAKKLAGQ
jgi:hypothetical protein